VVHGRVADRRERHAFDPDRGRGQLDGPGLDPRGLFHEQRAVSVVIRTQAGMIIMCIRPLNLMAVRRQPGVKHTEQYDQAPGRQRTKGTCMHRPIIQVGFAMDNRRRAMCMPLVARHRFRTSELVIRRGHGQVGA